MEGSVKHDVFQDGTEDDASFEESESPYSNISDNRFFVVLLGFPYFFFLKKRDISIFPLKKGHKYYTCVLPSLHR